jgi:hypothetical protein
VLQPHDVVLESFADETVAVHLGTGRYFSIDLIGTEILNMLQSGSALGAVVDQLAARSGADPNVVDPAVREFVRQLLDEGLLRPAPNGASSAVAPNGSHSSVPFTAPVLAVYSDMEDLLLLDPIHDVDETGWPARAKPATSDATEPLDSE